MTSSNFFRLIYPCFKCLYTNTTSLYIRYKIFYTIWNHENFTENNDNKIHLMDEILSKTKWLPHIFCQLLIRSTLLINLNIYNTLSIFQKSTYFVRIFRMAKKWPLWSHKMHISSIFERIELLRHGVGSLLQLESIVWCWKKEYRDIFNSGLAPNVPRTLSVFLRRCGDTEHVQCTCLWNYGLGIDHTYFSFPSF